MTAPQPCPYLDGEVERKLFTALYGDEAFEMNNALSHQGFRRSQNVLYRPSCPDCSACMSARIIVEDFKPSRSQRRILSRSKDLRRKIKTPWASEEHFDLFQRYLNSRHADGGMADMDVFEFSAMIEETPLPSRVVEYYRLNQDGEDELVAACLTDVLDTGFSLVYSFFDPEQDRRSLGSFIILDHITMAHENGLPFVYLGFWVKGSEKMDYKNKFQPLEVFTGGDWQNIRDLELMSGSGSPNHEQAVQQTSAIQLPDLD